MDLIAALALVLVIEGMVLAVFASSAPAILALMAELDPDGLRRAGIVSVLLGAVVYLLVREGAFYGG